MFKETTWINSHQSHLWLKNCTISLNWILVCCLAPIACLDDGFLENIFIQIQGSHKYICNACLDEGILEKISIQNLYTHDKGKLWHLIIKTTQTLACPFEDPNRSPSDHQCSSSTRRKTFSRSGQAMCLIIMAVIGFEFQTGNLSIILQKWSCDI